MGKKKINIIILGVSYFASMASAMRVRNLFKPLTIRENISIKNLIISRPDKINLFENQEKNENIKYKVVSYKYNILSILNFLLEIILAIKQMKQKYSYNILFVYGYPDLEKIFMVIFAKIFNYKILFDIPEDVFTMTTDFSGLQARINFYFARILTKKISFVADGIIVNAFHLKDQLRKIGGEKLPIALIPVSIDFSNFPSINNNNLDEDIRLFYAGSFFGKDGIDILLASFETISNLYKNVKLIMTGRGPKRHMDNFYNLVEKNGSKGKIFYKGCLPIKEYYSTLNSCDIMCMTRIDTAFANGSLPSKLVDYLASGKAVIATNVGEIKFYLIDKINSIIINPGSKNDLVGAIELLITNRDLRIKIGEEGKRTAKKYFDNYSVTQTFYSFIENNLLKK